MSAEMFQAMPPSRSSPAPARTVLRVLSALLALAMPFVTPGAAWAGTLASATSPSSPSVQQESSAERIVTDAQGATDAADLAVSGAPVSRTAVSGIPVSGAALSRVAVPAMPYDTPIQPLVAAPPIALLAQAAQQSLPASTAMPILREITLPVPRGFERGHSAAGVRRSGRVSSPSGQAPAMSPVPTGPATAPGEASAPASNASIPYAVDDSDSPTTLLPLLPPGMNETVVRVPVGDKGLTLETTVFKPEGDGPFPVVVFNHGKEPVDPREQPRARPLSFAREFVRRGYLVVVPNREGFAGSDGTYTEQLCDLQGIGENQATDIAATVAWLHTRPDADTSHVLVVGASLGGLATMAYGLHPAPGVRGLINFSGGLRQEQCPTWQQSLVGAFRAYGEGAPLPSLWLYGDNDQNWPTSLALQMRDAYREAGGTIRYVDFGDYKDNAHRLVGDRDGVAIWWPAVDRFLRQIGLPDAVCERAAPVQQPAPSHFAALDDVDSVPYLDEDGRKGYRTFLKQYPSRAFAVSSAGAWSWAEGGDDPITVAVDNCQRNSETRCRLYAIDDAVVWEPPSPAADKR